MKNAVYRRGVLPVLVLLALVVAGAVFQFVRGSTEPAPSATAAATATPTATPTVAELAVLRSLAAVERAYDAGNVRRLCRPGEILDPAVILAQQSQAPGCESELEQLMANVPRLRLAIRAIDVRPDLATAVVTTVGGNRATVDFVRSGRRWLMSFSAGEQPLPALAA